MIQQKKVFGNHILGTCELMKVHQTNQSIIWDWGRWKMVETKKNGEEKSRSWAATRAKKLYKLQAEKLLESF